MKLALLVAPLALAMAACTTPQAQLAAKDASCPSAVPTKILAAPENFRPEAVPYDTVACGLRATWNRSDVIARDNWRNLAEPHGETPAS